MKFCQLCSKPFTGWRLTQAFCSRACANETRRDPSRKCGNCGKWIPTGRQFCSPACKVQALAKDPKDRILAMVVVATNGCWEWQGTKTGGYGKAWKRATKHPVQAHRLAYEVFVGPIPDGLYLDHRCQNRACVNPEHLEPVTPAENVARAAHARSLRELARTCPLCLVLCASRPELVEHLLGTHQARRLPMLPVQMDADRRAA